jgi:Flp pilus assembly protein protease CpaA
VALPSFKLSSECVKEEKLFSCVGLFSFWFLSLYFLFYCLMSRYSLITIAVESRSKSQKTQRTDFLRDVF